VNLVSRIYEVFTERFDADPVKVASPGRINVIGEHTDYNAGFVFPAAIDKYIVLAIQKSDQEHCTVLADDLDEAVTFRLDAVAPAEQGSWKNYILGVVHEIQELGYPLTPFDIVFGGDIPGGSGLSSSAALENAVVYGINELLQLGLTREEMIFISQRAEHNYVGVKCGIMDQYASMFGRKDHLMLLDCRSIEAKHYPLELVDHEFVLINTNVKHSLADSAYNDRRAVCERVAGLMGKQALRDAKETDLLAIADQLNEAEFRKSLYVIREIERTQQAAEALMNGNINRLGELLYSSHDGLSRQYQVSCAELDFLVDQAGKEVDVLGARMMGGGFGGCTINLVRKSGTKGFLNRISMSYLEKFGKECSVYRVNLSDGTSLID
jgi:galactokinase